MGTQKILDTEVWCPMSGFKVKAGIIEPHKITVMEAVDGSLYARCQRHTTKVFIQDSMTVQQVLEVSTVVRTKLKRPRKEIQNGPS